MTSTNDTKVSCIEGSEASTAVLTVGTTETVANANEKSVLLKMPKVATGVKYTLKKTSLDWETNIQGSGAISEINSNSSAVGLTSVNVLEEQGLMFHFSVVSP